MSFLRAFIARRVTRLLTSPDLRHLRRRWAAARRRLLGQLPTVHYFHQVDDPYSHLAALQLQALTQRHAVRLVAHLVPAPDASAAPDPERLGQWAARDAQRLALNLGLTAPEFRRTPSSVELRNAQRVMAASLAQDASGAGLAALSQQFWTGQLPAQSGPEAAAMLAQGRALRARLGHYLGATFYFEGEWYWGVDRLHFLEQRLQEQGLLRPGVSAEPRWRTPELAFRALPAGADRRPILHFYASLRSPYTALAVPQVRRLAEHYGAELRIRLVLPMVMRGLPVPLSKRLYIVRDAKREAERLGLLFGCIVDPVGEPTERGLAVLHHAIVRGRGPDFLESFLRGVFAQGLDAGSDASLLAMAESAGLGQEDVAAALADDSWRAQAEANRMDMLTRGIWGVPSFRIDEAPALWGQDRLWMLEQDLLAALQAPVR
jgi:2-hydroxychromene-2-carboxylate isomerase